MKKRKSGGAWLPSEIIEGPAFRDLGATAIKVFLDLLLRRKMGERRVGSKRKPQWVVLNDGQIVYPYKEAQERGISPPAFTRAIDDLVNHGFIDICESGAGLLKTPTLYGFSERWREWGTTRFIEKPRRKQPLWKKGIGFEPGHDFYPQKDVEACRQHTQT